MIFFLLLSTREDILKNVGSQTVFGPQLTIAWGGNAMEVSAHQKVFV